MPIKRVQFPDGSIHRVEVPEGATNEQIIAFVASQAEPRTIEDRYAAAGIDPSRPNPADGMSGGQKALAGAGKFFVDTGRGVRQLGVDAAAMLGSDSAAEYSDELRQQETKRGRQDAALMDTGAGKVGYVGGALASMVVPGIGLRGGAAARALLPQTLAGNVAQGTALGAMQPVAEQDSRMGNMAVGGALGGAGHAVASLPAWAIRKAAGASPAITQAMQEQQAAQVIRQFAADPDRLARVPAELVPGSKPTLAEATDDIGLAGLERTLANLPDFGPQLALRRNANNTARVRAVEGAFNGADDTVAAEIRQQANKRASRMLRPVEGVPLETTKPLKDALDKLIVKHRAKANVRDALSFVRGELENVQTVGDAHGFRQTIGELMGGNIDGKAGGKLAKFELGTVRGLLDRQMRQAYPEWGDFLKGHRELSKQADQATIGANLLASGRAVRDATNDPVLTPAAFIRASNKVTKPANRPDRLRAKAVTPEQLKVIGDVRMDLERQARAMTEGRAVGSNTIQNAIGGNTLQSAVGPVGAAAIEPVSGVAMLAINQLRKTYGERTMTIVQDVMLNPDRAADVLAKLPSKRRQAVMSAIKQLPRYTAVAARSNIPSATQEEPLEIDIVGGTLVPGSYGP